MLSMKRILSLVLLVAMVVCGIPTTAVHAGTGTIASYPLPSIYTQSTAYSLKADGTTIPVVNYYGDYDYANFSMSGDSATVEVTASVDITDYSISPKKFNKTGSVNGKTLTFTIQKGEYLIVWVSGLKKLVITADPEETDKPASSGAGIFNVKDTFYNADSTGATLTTTAIQKAIDDASAYGGVNGQGIVYVPAGVYKISNLKLKSNVALYLEGGAVLRASANKADNIVFWHKDSQNHDITYVLYTETGADNVKIYGRGTVDGDGYNVQKVNHFGNNLVVPYCTSNFIMEGITVRDSASWSVTPIRSNDLVFTNIKLLNRMDLGENDGIDVCESQNVVVKNAIGIALDDPFSSKTWNETADISRNWFGSPEINENVTFDNCFSWTVCYGFKVGAGILQNQNNITFKNSYVYDCSLGIGIAGSYGTGSVSNITFDNIDIEKISFTNSIWRNWLCFFVQPSGARLTNVTVKNINVRDRGANPSILNGYSSSEVIDGVTFDNITMAGNTTPATSLDELNITNRSNYKNVRFLQSSSVRQAELFNSSSLVSSNLCSDANGGTYITGPNGAWAAFNNVDFGKGVSSIDLRAATANVADSSIELRLDSLTGPVIGTAKIANTGGIQNYATINVPVSGASGIHKLYLIFKRTSDSSNVASVNWFDVRYTKVEAESYNAMSGVGTETCSDTGAGLNLTDCNNGDWVRYDAVDFGSDSGASSMNFNVASTETGGTIELRLDDKTTGSLIGTAVIESTGSVNTWLNRNVKLTGATGVHNLFLVFKKSDASSFVKVNDFSFIKNTTGNEYKLPTGMTLNQPGVSMDIGQVTKLIPVFTPVDTNYNFATWSLVSESTPNVVTVDSTGLVTALKAGTAVVRGTSTDPNVYADCAITVSSQNGFTIASIPTVNVTTIAGVAPVLPGKVDTITDKGSVAVCDVTWGSIDPAQYQSMGNFTVSGDVSGTAIKATAAVAVTSASLPVSTSTTYEFESLPVVTSAGSSIVNAPDSSASGGTLVYFGNAVGDWVEYTANVPRAGTYNLKIKLKKHASKGIFQLYIDGVSQGTPYDEYANGNVYTEVDFGSVTFTSAGNKVFKFEITGKNASSGGPQITLDAVTLIPSFTGIKLDKSSSTLAVGDTTSLQAIFGNMDSESVTWSVLDESSSGVVSVTNTGVVTALKAGTAVVRVASNKYASVYADCFIRVKAASDILPVQLVTVVGKAPTLPSTVTVINTGDNSSTQAAVVWDSASANYSQAGNITIKGTVAGVTELAIANIKVFSPDTPLKVACVGDSITNGNGTANPNYSAYPIDLGRILGPNYVVGKFGVSGATLLKHGDLPYWNQTEYSNSLNFQPDVVIIQLGSNDSKSQNIGAYPGEFVSDYKELISSYRNLASHPLVYIALPPTVNTDDPAVAWGITDTALTNLILPKIRQVADEAAVSLIDNNTLTKGMPQNFPDKVHPNEEGAEILANHVFSVMTGIIPGSSEPGTVEAENYNMMSGVSTEMNSDVNGGSDVTSITNGDWIAFNNIDFGLATSRLDVRFASANSGGNIEFRLDSPTGTLIGTANVTNTGGWQTWVTKNVALTGASGVHNLYLVFTKPDGLAIANVNWFRLVPSDPPTSVTVSQNNISLVVAQTSTLTAQAAPLGSNTAITWTVRNESVPNVATVDAYGVVTAQNEGTAVIRAASTVDPNVFAECTVTVLHKQVKSVPPLNVTTTAGTAPALPSKLTVTYVDDSTAQLDVVWNILPSQYANVGSFTVSGTISGTTIPATATVTVNYASLPVTTKYEAENSLITVSSGTVPTGATDAGASNNKSIYFGSAVNDWITFTVNVPAAGTYAVKLGYKKRPANGKWDLFVNNSTTPLANIDMYASANTFASLDVGTVTINTAGNIPFKFQSTGKNASSFNYNLCADYITLTPVYSFTLDKATASVVQGLNTTLNPVFAGISAGNTGVKWTVQSESTPNVAAVSDTGVVTGVNPGTAVIRATSTVYNNFYAESTVTVQAATITALQPENVTTVEGIAPEMPKKVNATYDNNATIPVDVVWNTVDSSVYAKAGSYVVYGTVAGTAISAVAHLTVEPIHIVLNPSQLSLIVGQSAGVSATLNTPYDTVAWSVYSESAPGVVKVDQNGLVTAMNVGTAVVRATSTVSASVYADGNITVTAAPQVPLTIISIKEEKVTTVVGTKPQLPTVVTAVYSDNTTAPRPVLWNSIEPALYAQVRTFTVSGTVYGTPVLAVATITVEPKPTGGNDNGGGYIPPVEEPGKTVKVDVKEEDLHTAIENAKDNTVKINAQPVKEAEEVIVNIPAQQLLTLGEKKIEKVEIDTGIATVTVPAEVLKEAVQTGSTSLKLSVAKADAVGLAEEVKQAVGNNKIYDFTLSVDGNKISSFGDHAVNVEVSYTLKAGETANKVVVYHITDSGKLEIITNGRYNAATGKVVFSLKHFSKYAAGYVDVTFKDIGNVEWAKESIEALAARKVVDGIGDNAFDPDNKVTRAQFIKLLMKALELADETAQCSLSDVKPGEWYYNSIAAAQKLGIVVGKEDGTFGVDDEISRQDMAVMVYRAAKLLQLELGNQTTNTTEFIDKSEIAGYAVEQVAAMQKAGIILGDNGRFMPRDNATRAEAAVIIYRVFGFVN